MPDPSVASSPLAEPLERARRFRGVVAADVMRVGIGLALCAFQYWLLTLSIESYQAGDHRIVAAAAVLSALCFASVLGINATGESARFRFRREIARNDPQIEP